MRTAALAIVVMFAAVAVAQEKTEPIKLTLAIKLWDEYKENIVAADRKLTGKVVEFVAAGKIDKNKDGKYFLACCIIADDYPVPCVQCFIEPKSLDRLEKARPGEAFLIRGKCLGTTKNPRAWGGFFVTVSDCTILKTMVFDKKTNSWIDAS